MTQAIAPASEVGRTRPMEYTDPWSVRQRNASIPGTLVQGSTVPTMMLDVVTVVRWWCSQSFDTLSASQNEEIKTVMSATIGSATATPMTTRSARGSGNTHPHRPHTRSSTTAPHSGHSRFWYAFMTPTVRWREGGGSTCVIRGYHESAASVEEGEGAAPQGAVISPVCRTAPTCGSAWVWGSGCGPAEDS